MLDPAAGAPSGAGSVAGGQIAHVLHRDDDLQLERLGAADVDHRHRPRRAVGPVAAEEPGDLVEGPLGGGQADPLRRAVRDLLEPLETDGEVGAPLGGGHGVDLVDDDRLHVAERLARRDVSMR